MASAEMADAEPKPENPKEDGGEISASADLTANFFSEFSVPPPFACLGRLGKGSYGEVMCAEDMKTGHAVGIKRISNTNDDRHMCLRVLRELTLHRMLSAHPNVVKVLDVFYAVNNSNFRNVYIVMEKMDCDLHSLIRANIIPADVARSIIFQITCAMKYMHGRKVLHRDLKPQNVLISLHTRTVKLCDFGMARISSTEQQATMWTDYVATRWYRSPELVCSYFDQYSFAVDIWACGCIYAEVLNGKALFPGRNAYDQIKLIITLLGTPPDHEIDKFRSQKAREYIRTFPPAPRVDFAEKFAHWDAACLRMISGILVYDPNGRPSAEQILQDEYFSSMHEPPHADAGPIPKSDFVFEHVRSHDQLKALLVSEVQNNWKLEGWKRGRANDDDIASPEVAKAGTSTRAAPMSHAERFKSKFGGDDSLPK